MPRTPALSHLRALSKMLGSDAAQRELRWMEQHVSQHTRAETAPKLDDLVARRLRGEPLQYVLGTQPFARTELLTRAPVLIPRPETEDWTLRLADRLALSGRPVRLLDLCTGSGCVPLALCGLLPAVRAVAVDVDPRAVELARDNARFTGVPLAEDEGALVDERENGTFDAVLADITAPSFARDLLARVRGGTTSTPPFNVLTSNPPYIPPAEYAALDASVRDWEARAALLGQGTDGLGFYRVIARLVIPHSTPDAVLLLESEASVVLEVGAGQAQAVAEIMEDAGLRRVEIWKDPWSVERTVFGRMAA